MPLTENISGVIKGAVGTESQFNGLREAGLFGVVTDRGHRFGYIPADGSPVTMLASSPDSVPYVEEIDGSELITIQQGATQRSIQISTLGEWTGTLVLGETNTTAYRGDRGKTAYDHSQITTGNPHGTTAAQVGAQGYAEEYDSQTIAFTSNYNSPISPIHTFSANFFSKNKTVRIAGCINSGDLVGKQLKFLVDGASSFPFYAISTAEQGFLFEIFIKCLTAPSSGNVDLLITGRITSSSSKLSESTIYASYAVGSAHTIGISVDNAGASGSVECYMWTVEQLSKGA